MNLTKCGASILGVQRSRYGCGFSKYGIVDCVNADGRLYKVNGMVEKPKREDAPSDIAVLGRYIITPQIFECLERTPKGAGGEIQLTDALVLLSRKRTSLRIRFRGKTLRHRQQAGILQATVDFALSRDDLRDEFSDFLKEKLKICKNFDISLDINI